MQKVIYTLEVAIPVAQAGDVSKIIAAGNGYAPQIISMRMDGDGSVSPFKKNGMPRKLTKHGTIDRRGGWCRHRIGKATDGNL